jgi:hypothetical protein
VIFPGFKKCPASLKLACTFLLSAWKNVTLPPRSTIYYFTGFFFDGDNPTRKFLTNQIAPFFKFGPIKLIYSEKTPGRVKKQRAVFQRKNLCQNETSTLLGQLDKNFLGGLIFSSKFVI